MRKIFLCLFVFMLASVPAYSAGIQDNYDIIIAGGGTGGISAAIQAVSMGAEVLVIEASGMLGGQAIAAGVANMDDLSSQRSGIYADFISRVEEYYSSRGKSIGTSYWDPRNLAFEPHIGLRILQEMARGENAPDILYRSEIVAVGREEVISVNGDTVSGLPQVNSVIIRTPEGMRNITCKVLIDATEYGDILPLAGSDYMAGNSATPSINHQAMIQDITWTAVIRKYPGGIPEHLKPKSPLPGYDMARINYANYVAKDGFTFKGEYPVKLPVDFITHNVYRGLPDSFTPGNFDATPENWPNISKCSVNWANDFPGQNKLGDKYGLPVSYLEDRNLRSRLERDALIKTLHFIYYLQNELGESWSVDENEYGELPEAARDFPDEWKVIARHLPPVPYVRESRRGVGDKVLTSKELFENSLSYKEGRGNHEFQDAIAIGCYHLDLHHTDIEADMESYLGEKQVYIEQHRPRGNFQVPMSILIPRNVDGLILAEKNLSMSRLVAGALRLQPITMMTGQAAGALAAISILRNTQPRNVKAIHVQEALLKSGVNLSLCTYSDVPANHRYYRAVQIASLYRLLEPEKYPDTVSYDVGYDITFVLDNPELVRDIAEGRDKGRFGVDEPLSIEGRRALIVRVKELTGQDLTLPEGEITRGAAVDFVMRTMVKL
ncbi:MAG: FAD-dependent oxidoreductase [Synergistaceae bacterium]|nr:FAD-dependent oxidoreductase [Synergistaceae bacterium]